MRRLVLALVLATTPALAQTKPTKPTPEQIEASLESHRVRLWNAAQPTLRVKLDGPVKQLVLRADVKPKPNEPPIDLLAEAKRAVAPLATNNADIEALAILVLLQASKSTSDDLKDLVNKMKERKDGMSDVGEAQQLRLQMLMDRRSKLQEALSNLMKKISDTQSSIVTNMK